MSNALQSSRKRVHAGCNHDIGDEGSAKLKLELEKSCLVLFPCQLNLICFPTRTPFSMPPPNPGYQGGGVSFRIPTKSATFTFRCHLNTTSLLCGYSESLTVGRDSNSPFNRWATNRLSHFLLVFALLLFLVSFKPPPTAGCLSILASSVTRFLKGFGEVCMVEPVLQAKPDISFSAREWHLGHNAVLLASLNESLNSNSVLHLRQTYS